MLGLTGPATARPAERQLIAAVEPAAQWLRIAVPPLWDGFWTVGPIHLGSLMSALRDAYGRQLGLFVFPAAAAGQGGGWPTQLDGVIAYTYPRRWSAGWLENWLYRHLRGRDVAIQRALESHGMDVALCTGFSSSYGRVATMWWLTDFQHLKLPEMFDPQERAQRTAVFLSSSKAATRIVAMSESVRQDFEAFAPQQAWKVRVLRPVSHIPGEIYQTNPRTIARLYNLPEKFVYLPNQFWKHKNHELVLRAVKILKDRGVEVHVVCTGNLGDYRHPLQASELFQSLSIYGLRHQVLYVGLLAHNEVLALMRQSVCVLNPSLFEGWGYSIDEARSLGKRVLVSDIGAHRDQHLPKATFFDPYEPEDLAGKLAEIWEESEPGPDLELEREARRQLPARRRAYAQQFVAIAQEAIAAARC
jgi:glycosyltransferase involved in cell wall biosynthesis